MALPCPGPAPISLLDIQNEFGGSYLDGTYTQIKEYYRGGGYVVNNTTNNNIPTSGQISFNQFFCSSGEIVVYITQDTANVDVSSLFGLNWTSLFRKRLVINSGVRVYNTNPYAISNLAGYAMRIYDTFNGQLTIQNYGSIQGAAGRRGGDTILAGESRTNQSNGGQGGNAIYIGPTTYGTSGNGKIVYIDNQGTIYAGGGGGGAVSNSFTYSFFVPAQQSGGYNVTFSGNVSGIGGFGQGYNQTNTAGSIIADSSIGISGSAVNPNPIYYYVANNATMSISFGINYSYLNVGNDSTIPYLYVNYAYNRISVGNGSNIQSSVIQSSYNTINIGNNSTIKITVQGSYNTFNIGSNVSGSITVQGSYTTLNIASTSISISGNAITIGNLTINNIGSYNTARTNQPEQNIVTNYTNTYVYVPVTNSTYSVPNGTAGGNGGTFGNPGDSVQNGFPGGPSGYAIANRSQYVSYINQGTIAGQTT